MFKIEFKTSGAAYQWSDTDWSGNEYHAVSPDAVADSVNEIAAELRRGRTAGPVIDTNGNTVGTWSLTDD